MVPTIGGIERVGGYPNYYCNAAIFRLHYVTLQQSEHTTRTRDMHSTIWERKRGRPTVQRSGEDKHHMVLEAKRQPNNRQRVSGLVPGWLPRGTAQQLHMSGQPLHSCHTSNRACTRPRTDGSGRELNRSHSRPRVQTRGCDGLRCHLSGTRRHRMRASFRRGHRGCRGKSRADQVTDH
jgi:hypothetical protein